MASERRVTFHLAHSVLSKIDLALRQYARTQAALVADLALRQQLGFRQGRTPDAIVSTTHDIEDAAHFLVLALRQAVRGHWVLESRGCSLPPIQASGQIRALRDLHEHWDRWAAEPYGLSDEPWRQSRAGEEWAALSESRPERSMGWQDEEDGTVTFTTFRGLELPPILEDLRTVRASVEERMHTEFAYEYPSVEDAQRLVGGSRLLAATTFTTLRGFRDVAGVHRFEREELIRAVAMVDAHPGISFPEELDGDS